MKKKIETEVNATTNSTDPELSKKLVYGISPLELTIDLGRHDLNDVVGKLQDKINELIRKQN